MRNNLTIFSLKPLLQLVEMIEGTTFGTEGFVIYLIKRIIGVILNIHKFAATLCAKSQEPEGKLYIELVHRILKILMNLSENSLENSFLS